MLLGAERLFWQTDGVYTTAVGYSGGYTPNPTYEEVCSGQTAHAEVVLVVFDPARVTYEALVKLFFESHDPTQGMRQGGDVGTQYRSVIQFTDERQRELAATRRRPTTTRCARQDSRRSRPRSSPRNPSTTPRITTSSTCTRCRTATAGWKAQE